MNKLALRAVSGLLYVAVIVCSLILNDVYFCFLCVIFGVLATMEFGKLTAYKHGDSNNDDLPSLEEREPPLKARATDIFGILIWTLPCVGLAYASGFGAVDFTLLLCGTVWVLYAIIRCYVSIYQDDGYAVRDLAYSMLAQVYIGIGIISAQILSIKSCGLVLLIFIYIWLNDTGAFLVGSACGRHKLFPRLSPNKTWEGFLGGLFLSIAAGIALLATGVTQALLQYTMFGPWQVAFLLPAIVGITGTLGDLFESMIKRSVNAKDSGTLIPGHGGILDRIDSMLFAMPAAYAFTYICFISACF